MENNQDHILSTDPALDQITRGYFVNHTDSSLLENSSVPSSEFVNQLLSNLTIDGDSKALILGTGTGYLPAVFSRLVRQVVAFEKDKNLKVIAENNLKDLGISNVMISKGDGRVDDTGMDPYDIIIVLPTSDQLRNIMLERLGSEGQLLALEIREAGKLILVKYLKQQGRLTREELGAIQLTQYKDDIFTELGGLDNRLLEQAKVLSKKNHTPVLDEIRKLASLGDEDIFSTLSVKYKLDLGKADELLKKIDANYFHAFSRAFLEHYHLIPLYQESGTLKVATMSPDASLTDVQQVFPDLKVEKILVPPTDYQRLWSALDLVSHRKDHPEFFEDDNTPEEVKESATPEAEAHLIYLFQALLLDAVAERASDIHLEQYGERVRVRLRIDGELRDLNHYQMTPLELRGLVNVIKLKSELNIAERRLPQGGRSRLKVGDDSYDLRIQVQPSLYAEHVVIRLLKQNNTPISLSQLGMSKIVADSYKRLLWNPAGLVLVVGPTGSGKSTTLFSGLKMLAEDGSRKVLTVEDPIEYSIDGISQTRVRPEIGFTFDDAMRSFVRLDPDVILVGEIRDQDTAVEAIRASQTGHVVLSTLHCNDAIDAVQRLYDLKIHPNSLASELLAVFAQRLAKRICKDCRVEAEPDPVIMEEVFPHGIPDSFKCFEGKGCSSCDGEGTHGRVGVIEYIAFNQDLRNAVSMRMPIGQLRKLALDNGLITMRDSALDHVISGTIPLTELPRILPAERMAPESRWDWEKTS